MSGKEVFLTEEGLANLEEELDELKAVKRKEIAEKIKAALAFGDISENSEYDQAKNDQAKLESRIMRLEDMVANAVLIDESKISLDKVGLGSKVLVKDLELDKEMEFTIVGSAETDPFEGKISNESPLGSSLIGNKVGSIVEAQVPDGVVEYEILSISK